MPVGRSILQSGQVGTELIRALRDERPIRGRHVLLERVGSEEGNDEAPTGQQPRDRLVNGGDSYVYENGQLTAINHPAVRAVAERFKDRPGLAPERWYQVPRQRRA